MQAIQDQSYIQQQLRSVIIHSLDNFNYRNAEFAGERLISLDSMNPDTMYLYCLALFRQEKYKSCYNVLVDYLSTDNLGCSFLFSKCCYMLKKFKEGIYQLLKINFLYNEVVQENSSVPYSFTTPKNRFQYEHQRSIYPDSSTIYHLLGDLYRGIGDVKNCALNYGECLKFNPFDFEAFQELCKLGVNVRVKALFKSNQQLINELSKSKNSSVTNSGPQEHKSLSNPFSSGITAVADYTSTNPDDTFSGGLATPRIAPVTIPDAPIRRPNNNAAQFEFTKPSFPLETIEKPTKKESTYSKITSRLISQPSNQNNSSENNSGNGKKAIRGGLKRNSSNSFAPAINENNQSHSSNIMAKEIEQSDNALLGLYLTFAKSFKSMCKYDCYKAIRILESLSETEKESPWVLSKLGRLHYEIVNYKQSEYYFVKLRKLDRTRTEDMEYYSTLLWHLHKKVELTYLANELHDIDSESPITWCVIGNLFSLTREPDEAIKCFNKAIKLDDTFTYAYTLKGHEYFSNDNYEMALENFRISLLLDSRHYNALYGIGMVYINLGDYQKADYHFRKAVSINPINIILICCVGMVLEKLGKKSIALRQYELASKLQPLNPLPLFKKAQLLFSMQHFSQALKLFETLKELAPDEASVHFLLGQLYNIQKDKFQAVREFTIALNLDPKGNYLIREAMESFKEK